MTDASAGAYALTGVTALLGDELEPVENATIVIEAGLIADVGTGPAPDGMRRLHRPNLLITPGLINCHTHVGDALLAEEGFNVPGEDLLYAPHGLRHRRLGESASDELVPGMRRAMRYMIRCGTVAFADFREQGLGGVALLRKAADGLPLHVSALGRHADYPLQPDEELRDNTGELTVEQAAEISMVLTLADGFSVVSPNNLSDAALAQTAQIVRDAGKALAAHAGEMESDRQTSIARTGRSDIVRAIETLRPDYLVHLTAATTAELEMAAKAEIPVVMCPRSHAGLGYGVPPFLAAVEAGATVGIGTDNAMTTSPNVLAEVNFLCKAERWRTGSVDRPDPRRLLAAITVDAARILGLDSHGSLAPGKTAALVAFDATSSNLADSVRSDPLAALVNRAETADIRAVLINGRTAWGTLSGPPAPAA
jgi:cytosine/adenosine deaminase-related metal-dependent hydrolase